MWLQRMIHIAGIANFTYGIYFQMYLLDIPSNVSKTRKLFGGPWKYLTFINQWFQLAFYILGLLNVLFGSLTTDKKRASTLQRWKDNIFATLAFPIGMFVGLAFWAIYLVNREMIFPAILDKYIPTFENHVLHTTCILLQVLELCSAYHIYPERKRGMFLTGFVCFGYLLWICFIAYHGGFWVYPVLKHLSTTMRVIFVVACFFFGCILYIVGEVLNKLIWSKVLKIEKKKRSD